MTFRKELILGGSKQPLQTVFLLQSDFILFHFGGEEHGHLPDLLLLEPMSQGVRAAALLVLRQAVTVAAQGRLSVKFPELVVFKPW